MGLLRRGLPRFEAPQKNVDLRWDNPLLKGLQFLVLGATGWKELTGRASLGPPQFVGYRGQKMGRGMYVSTSIAGLGNITVPGMVGVPNYTLLTIGNIIGGGTGNSIDDHDASTAAFQFRMDSGTTPQLIVFDTGGNPYFATGPALSTQELEEGFVFVGTVAGNSLAVWGNKTKTTGVGTSLQPITGVFGLGARKNVGSQDWTTGGMLVNAGYNRTLTDREILAINENFAEEFFSPHIYNIPFSDAGGGGNTFTFNVSGGVAFSGSVTPGHENNIPVSGGLSLSGTVIQNHENVIPVSGSVVFGGTAPISTSAQYTFNVSGGVSFAGAVIQNHENVIIPNGGIGCSGSIIQTHDKILNCSGGINFGGNASFYFVPSGGGGDTPRRTLVGVGT